MLLYERAAEHDPELDDVVWFIDSDNFIIFSYLPDLQELWEYPTEHNTSVDMPIATPATLADARTIIEQAGHTIS